MSETSSGEVERRTCEANCDNPATHRLENAGGEHLYTCGSCAEKFNGKKADLDEISEGKKWIITQGGSNA